MLESDLYGEVLRFKPELYYALIIFAVDNPCRDMANGSSAYPDPVLGCDIPVGDTSIQPSRQNQRILDSPINGLSSDVPFVAAGSLPDRLGDIALHRDLTVGVISGRWTIT